MEFNAFVHFGPNTFTGNEWGTGKEPTEVFNPTHLDCVQWCKTFKAAGMKGVIITAKHHDGFCLWPSKYSTHTVAQSPWKGGKGDVLKELSDACHKTGLKFGVYLSPWDRNHPAYGTPEYNKVFVNMLHEVLTNYGPVFEVWFDGANGEGPNGKKQVYDWPLFNGTVKKLQPNAVIFSDAGPGVRWVGNEDGIAGETNWSTINRDDFSPGQSDTKILNEGLPDGKDWLPAECDVSIRPGWFYRSSEDAKVKTPEQLEEIYYKSVGRNGLLLLNVPPGPDGLIHKEDIAALQGLRDRLSKRFRFDRTLDRGRTLQQRNQYVAQVCEVHFSRPEVVDTIVLGEDIAKGQHVGQFKVSSDAKTIFAEGTTIGYKRILRFPPVRTKYLKLEITVSSGDCTISQFQAFGPPRK